MPRQMAQETFSRRMSRSATSAAMSGRVMSKSRLTVTSPSQGGMPFSSPLASLRRSCSSGLGFEAASASSGVGSSSVPFGLTAAQW